MMISRVKAKEIILGRENRDPTLFQSPQFTFKNFPERNNLARFFPNFFQVCTESFSMELFSRRFQDTNNNFKNIIMRLTRAEKNTKANKFLLLLLFFLGVWISIILKEESSFSQVVCVAIDMGTVFLSLINSEENYVERLRE